MVSILLTRTEEFPFGMPVSQTLLDGLAGSMIRGRDGRRLL